MSITELLDGLAESGFKKETQRSRFTDEVKKKAIDTKCVCGRPKKQHKLLCGRCEFVGKFGENLKPWAETICVKCRKHEAEIGKDGKPTLRCPECLAYNRRTTRANIRRYREMGLCSCGNKLDDSAKKTCSVCSKRVAESKALGVIRRNYNTFNQAVVKLCEHVLLVDPKHEKARIIMELMREDRW